MRASPRATRWTNASMFVTTLITEALAERPDVEHAPPHRLEHGACARTAGVAADDHRDLAGRRVVDAAGDRRLERRDAALARARRAARARAGRSCSCRSRWRRGASPQHAVLALNHRRDRGGRREARDRAVRISATPRRVSGPARAVLQRAGAAAGSRSWTVSSTPARRRLRGEMAAEPADADEGDPHGKPSGRRRVRGGARHRCTGCRPATSSSSSTPRPGSVGGST